MPALTTHVTAFHGSIVDPALGAHAIINASNPEIALGSGASGSVSEACGGHSFRDLVRKRWEEEFDEPLEASDCLVTTGGTATAFAWVLHVPAVDYRHRDPQTGGASGPARIAACTRSALAAAERLAASHCPDRLVLGTPLLGAGHGGLGPVSSADAMLGAVHSHLHQTNRTGLAAITFAVLKQAHLRVIHHAATKWNFRLQ